MTEKSIKHDPLALAISADDLSNEAVVDALDDDLTEAIRSQHDLSIREFCL